MNRAQYQNYLWSAEWAAKREAILQRARGICERCSKRPARHIHHKTYDRVGHEWHSDLLAVCVGCHEELHGFLEPMTLEDERQAMLADLQTRAARKAQVIEWHSYGLVTKDQVGVFFYVWGLDDA